MSRIIYAIENFTGLSLALAITFKNDKSRSHTVLCHVFRVLYDFLFFYAQFKLSYLFKAFCIQGIRRTDEMGIF